MVQALSPCLCMPCTNWHGRNRGRSATAACRGPCLIAGATTAGAIDVEELQYALEVMGIQKTAADVQELMDSVDKDGSGEPVLGAWAGRGSTITSRPPPV